MRMSMLLISASLVLVDFTNAEPPNLVHKGLQQQRTRDMAIKEFSPIWEKSIIAKSSVLGAREIIEALGQNSELLSTECAEDIGLMIAALVDYEKAALMGNGTLTDFDREAILPMLDSNGRIGPAILKGHFYFAGHFSECKAVNFAVEERTRRFRGEHFRITVDIAFRDNTVNGSCSLGDFGFQFGVCLPAGCSSEELLAVLRPATGESAIPNPVCRVQRTNDDVPPIDAGFYVTVSILGVIAAVSILAGVADYFFTERAKNYGFSNALPWRLLMAFSLYANVASTFDEGQIGPMHCIRFFSMSWVVLGHFCSSYMVTAANPLDIVKMSRDFLSEIILNAYFAVDSFFFMSGLLLTFIWFKNYNKNPHATNSPVSWIMFYVHRIIRLSPPYYMAVAFYTWVFKQLLVDRPINMTPYYTDDYCRETWYIALLYVQNWWKSDKQCLGVSWYLATEMQIFLFTPLLILPLAIKPALGSIIAGAMLTISTAANIFLMYYFHWPTNSAFFTPDPEMKDYSEYYNMLMYNSPLIRCQIYIMGMLVGWFIQSKKGLKIHPFINLTGWVLSIALMLCILFGLYDQTNGVYIDVFWRAMYSALSRIAWGVGLSWIIISCWYGYGGPINQFMSWHIWIPFGRLTYCGYLLHIPIMALVLGQSTDEVFFTNFIEAFITRVVSTIFVTFLVSTFWSALFEISFGKVQMILLEGLRLSAVGKKRPDVEESWTDDSPKVLEKREE